MPGDRASYTGVPACQGSAGCARDACAFPHSQFGRGDGGPGNSALGPCRWRPPREPVSWRVTAAGVRVLDTRARSPGAGETAVPGPTPGSLTRTLDTGPGVCIYPGPDADASGYPDSCLSRSYLGAAEVSAVRGTSRSPPLRAPFAEFWFQCRSSAKRAQGNRSQNKGGNAW